MAWHYLLSRVFERRAYWPNGVRHQFARRAHGPVFLAGRIANVTTKQEAFFIPAFATLLAPQPIFNFLGATISHIARIAEIVACMAVNCAKEELESRR
ncbi:hypothetical protein [Caballeronia sp.]|uniref:hypothetical protein n=1 Tax=Caballeronia sp. TaxID=1931223 RepID=UPI003C661480